MEFQVLRVHHYGETVEEDRRITISPANVVVLAAAVEDCQVQGRSVRKVTALFVDSGSIDLVVNHSDLELLEHAVGAYCLG